MYDLAGRRVRRLHEAAEGVGTYVQTWDGRGEDGRLLPPGLYVVRVSAQTDGDAATVT
ncbi:MAG TPA: flagellar hook capping protein, partial [Candidatus Latescibacteria bacterium]|nr:flagellar hook capping protein [Candidatus Latescibacterota bacterium]